MFLSVDIYIYISVLLQMSPPLALQQGKFRALQPQWDEAPTWSGWLRCPECDVGAQSAKGCGQHCFLTGCRWIWMEHSKIWFGEIHLSIYIYVILIDSMCIYREREIRILWYVLWDQFTFLSGAAVVFSCLKAPCSRSFGCNYMCGPCWITWVFKTSVDDCREFVV